MTLQIDKADRHAELREKRGHKLPFAMPDEQNIPHGVEPY